MGIGGYAKERARKRMYYKKYSKWKKEQEMKGLPSSEKDYKKKEREEARERLKESSKELLDSGKEYIEAAASSPKVIGKTAKTVWKLIH